MLEARLAKVPEDFRDLVPGNLNPEAKLEWLTAAESKGLFKAVGQKKTEPVGEHTNPAGSQTSDLNQLSPMQMLRAAYGQK